MKTLLSTAALGLAALVSTLATPAIGAAQYRPFTPTLRPYARQRYVANTYRNRVQACRPPFNNPPIYNPPIYTPPIYTPPIYNNPPIYTPPIYNNPPIYTPPIYNNPLNPGQTPYIQNPLNPVGYPTNPYTNPYPVYGGY